MLQLMIFLPLLVVSQGNIALYKPTSQSSTNLHYRSFRAVDGKKLTDLPSGSCTQTNYQREPWWRVDLLQPVLVWLVKITNRGDCCWEKLKEVQIRVGNSLSGPDNNSLCAYSHDSLGEGETKDYFCSTPRTGRYVYVALMVTEVLTLCEVEVYASDVVTVSPTRLTGNIARGKPTSQSSNYFECPNNICHGNASKAVDGGMDTDFFSGSCTHTDSRQMPWWRVDLGKREVVRKVSLTNRGDCCSERLKDVEVRVGDNGCSDRDNPLCQSFKGEVGLGMTVDIYCKRRGRFLYVRLKYQEYLVLCEVKVYAEEGATLPWTKGIVPCNPSSEEQSGSAFGYVAAPFVAFLGFFCFIKLVKKCEECKPQPQHTNDTVAVANPSQAQSCDDSTAQSQPSITRRNSAPLETTDLPRDSFTVNDGSAFDANKSALPIPSYSVAIQPVLDAPPPSYEEAIGSTYDNAAFELESTSENRASFRNNMDSILLPRYSSLRRTRSFDERWQN